MDVVDALLNNGLENLMKEELSKPDPGDRSIEVMLDKVGRDIIQYADPEALKAEPIAVKLGDTGIEVTWGGKVIPVGDFYAAVSKKGGLVRPEDL